MGKILAWLLLKYAYMHNSVYIIKGETLLFIIFYSVVLCYVVFHSVRFGLVFVFCCFRIELSWVCVRLNSGMVASRFTFFSVLSHSRFCSSFVVSLYFWCFHAHTYFLLPSISFCAHMPDTKKRDGERKRERDRERMNERVCGPLVWQHSLHQIWLFELLVDAD